MNFAEYLLGLLHRPFKLKEDIKRFVDVIGYLYDEAKKVVYTIRRIWFLKTCPVDVLGLFGEDYGIPQLPGEAAEAYRQRLLNVFDWYYWMGTNKGIIQAIRLIVDVPCRIREYQVDCWKLGRNRLGRDTRLFDTAYLYKFGLIFDKVLSSADEQLVKKVVNVVKAAHTMFFIRYPTIDKQNYWRLGISKIGRDTILTKGADN